MATLSIVNRFLAYEDGVSSNNPQKRPFDWSRQMQGVPVDNPAVEPFRIPPFHREEIFNGTRTLDYDNTTEYSISNLNIDTTRYRLKWTGVGTAPGFRTVRTVNFTAGTPPVTITITPQLNQSVKVTSNAGAVFGDVEVGDTVYIPGLSTGDTASIFSSMNEGIWLVLDATTTQLTLARTPCQVYSSLAETVTITDNASFQVFSSHGVQLDDTLSLACGFSTPFIQNYEIVAVTADSIDFISGTTLPDISDIIPGENSIIVFSNAKSWIYLETDQNLKVSINSSLSYFDVEPLLAGDPNKVGVFQLMGTVYYLCITNKSSLPATVRILSVE